MELETSGRNLNIYINNIKGIRKFGKKQKHSRLQEKQTSEDILNRSILIKRVEKQMPIGLKPLQ